MTYHTFVSSHHVKTRDFYTILNCRKLKWLLQYPWALKNTLHYSINAIQWMYGGGVQNP